MDTLLEHSCILYDIYGSSMISFFLCFQIDTFAGSVPLVIAVNSKNMFSVISVQCTHGASLFSGSYGERCFFGSYK